MRRNASVLRLLCGAEEQKARKKTGRALLQRGRAPGQRFCASDCTKYACAGERGAGEMERLVNFFLDTKDVLLVQMSTFGIMDVIDLLVVAFVVYKAIGLIRETRAAQLIKGIVLLLILLQLSEWLNMNTINFILRNTMQLGLIAVLIIFQPELRRGLEKMGRSKFGSKVLMLDDDEAVRETEEMIGAVCEACDYLSRNKIGALMVFERDTKIGEIIKTGTGVDAEVTAELIVTIFFPNNPLHDGAVVLRRNRIHAAGCFLPLTQKSDLSKELGTRHRAAIGVSENSDAYVVVVSEETGKISTVEEGVITRNFKPDTLREDMRKHLLPTAGTGKKTVLGRIRGRLIKK